MNRRSNMHIIIIHNGMVIEFVIEKKEKKVLYEYTYLCSCHVKYKVYLYKLQVYK